MYSNKVNGHAAAGEHLTSNLDYFTVTTPVNLTASVANGISALDKLVEVISLNGQPVIMGAVSGSGPYTLKFATEHNGSWTTSDATAPGVGTPGDAAAALKAALIKHGVDFGFDANTTVTVSTSL